jgi:hypothetical protein
MCGDRIGDANKSRWRHRRMFSSRTASSSQRHLSPELPPTPRVSLPNESLDTRRRSNLIANIDLRAYRDISLRADVAWNPQLSSTDKTQLALRTAAGNRVVNLGFASRGTSVGKPTFGRRLFGKRWSRRHRVLRDNKNLENRRLRFHGIAGAAGVVRCSISSRTSTTPASMYSWNSPDCPVSEPVYFPAGFNSGYSAVPQAVEKKSMSRRNSASCCRWPWRDRQSGAGCSRTGRRHYRQCHGAVRVRPCGGNSARLPWSTTVSC